ncbi:MAG: hypothetical protein MMC33_009572 [Icmadophila ericetorum]|nr:hypothetical protein [Icmadophila ericetorum]
MAAEKLFEIIFVRFRKDSLQKLMAISKHPVLSTSVKTIVYEADGHLQDYWNFEESHDQFKLVGSLGHETRDEWLFGSILDEASRLASSMTNLSNLDDVRFEDLTDLWPRSQDAQRLTELVLRLPKNLRGCGVRSLAAIMRAASVMANNVRHLEISNQSHGLHYNCLNLEGLDMYHTICVFTNLTHIGIYLNTVEGELGSIDVLRKGNLAELLMAASNLQELSLGFDQRPHARVELVHLLGSETWKDLTRLDISAIDFHIWEMEGFFLRHQNLAWIGLANSRLHSGQLRQLFDLLKGNVVLQSVALDGALGDSIMDFDFLEHSENRRKGTAYVLGHGQYPHFEMTKIDGN